MESRIEILDRLSKTWGAKDGIETFEDFCRYYNSDAIRTLVCQAMNQHSIQFVNELREKKKEKV